MAYHYGDMPRATPACFAMDHEYMEKRWGVMRDQGYHMIVMKGSVVSLTKSERDALEWFPAAWRYEIGENRIECLFIPDYEHAIELFSAHEGVEIIEEK